MKAAALGRRVVALPRLKAIESRAAGEAWLSRIVGPSRPNPGRHLRVGVSGRRSAARRSEDAFRARYAREINLENWAGRWA